MDTKLTRLNRICQTRLHFSQQWQKVTVHVDSDEIVILWSDTKKDWIWSFHEKRCSLNDLDRLIRQQADKLRAEFRSRHEGKRYRV